MNLKKDENDNYNFDEVKDIFFYKVFDEFSTFRNKFQAQEIVICTDSSNYWRKDIWKGYKGSRKKQRQKTNVNWDQANKAILEAKKALLTTSFKTIEVNKAEGDDIIFVLSEYLSLLGQEVVIYSSDHDFIQCLEHEGVKFWRTTRTTGMQNSKFYTIEEGELVHIILDHVIGGDPGDDIKNVKGFSRFSQKCKEIYPDLTELRVWEKRFEFDTLFEKTYGVSAYSHPPYGYKRFLKSKKTLEDLLNEDNIFRLNYALNRQIALPEGIPQWLSSDVIQEYKKPNQKDLSKLQEFFIKNGLFDLVGKLVLF